MRRAGWLVVVTAALVLSGCGDDTDTTLERADRALAELPRGDMTMRFTAQATGAQTPTPPVGFSLAGRYDLEAGTALPVLDMTYTRLLGEQEEVVNVQSDGNRIVVTTDGQAVDVPPEEAERLRLVDGDRPTGLDELGLAGWVRNPEETPGPEVDGVPTRRVTGAPNAGDIVSDLAVLATQVSGQQYGGALDEEAEARVQAKVRSGDVEVLLDEDDVPRRLRVTVDFGAAVAPEVQQALGPYAGARLELNLELRAPGAPVTPPTLA